METSFKIKELNVPVPWGHVAVKTWGDEKDKAVLVIHGRMDNAGSFDGLIPLLPNPLYYICIDLPGHGRSTHFPPYLPIYSVNYLIVYKLVMQFFQRPTFILLGHSYGSHIGFLFAQLYPHCVEKFIMLDAVHFFIRPVSSLKDFLTDALDRMIQLNEKITNGKQPTYTYEEAFSKVTNGRGSEPLTPQAATALLKRSITPTADGRYKFTLDHRMKFFINPLHDFRYAVASMKKDPVTCPVLIVLAKESTGQQIYMMPIIEVLNKWNNVVIKYVDGDHDVHMLHPELVAPHIYEFLLNQKSKM